MPEAVADNQQPASSATSRNHPPGILLFHYTQTKLADRRDEAGMVVETTNLCSRHAWERTRQAWSQVSDQEKSLYQDMASLPAIRARTAIDAILPANPADPSPAAGADGVAAATTSVLEVYRGVATERSHPFTNSDLVQAPAQHVGVDNSGEKPLSIADYKAALGDKSAKQSAADWAGRVGDFVGHDPAFTKTELPPCCQDRWACPAKWRADGADFARFVASKRVINEFAGRVKGGIPGHGDQGWLHDKYPPLLLVEGCRGNETVVSLFAVFTNAVWRPVFQYALRYQLRDPAAAVGRWPPDFPFLLDVSCDNYIKSYFEEDYEFMRSTYGPPKCEHSFKVLAQSLRHQDADIADEGSVWYFSHLQYDWACLLDPTLPLGTLQVLGRIGHREGRVARAGEATSSLQG